MRHLPEGPAVVVAGGAAVVIKQLLLPSGSIEELMSLSFILITQC